MAKKLMSREEAINQLYETIKTRFEQDGILQEVRCMLQSKMVTMMKGKNDPINLVPLSKANEDSAGDDAKRDPRMLLLHQLIMEYFHWHGFQYSAEMFAMESNSDNAKPMRECLEGVLGPFQHKNIPILLEIVAELMSKHT